MTDIRSRKADHIALSLQSRHKALHGQGRHRLSFGLNALPQFDTSD